MKIEDTFITFAGSVATKKKVEKDIKVKGYVRKGKFVQSFQRKQDVNDKTELAKKVAIGSLAVLGGVLGVSLASAAVVKLRYNSNLVKLGKQMAEGKNTTKMRTDLRNYSIPKELGDKKDSMTFVFPGLGKAEELFEDGAKMTGPIQLGLKSANKDLLRKTEIIPTGYTEMVAARNAAGKMDIKKDILNYLEKSVKKGESQDAKAIAQEIFDWHKLNPYKDIRLITQSAGGMVARDTTHILVNAGVPSKQIRMLGVGSPNYGLVDDIVETKYVMHSDDPFTNISLNKDNTQWVKSPKGTIETMVDEEKLAKMQKDKFYAAQVYHSGYAYWSMPSSNTTAKATIRTANELFLKKL